MTKLMDDLDRVRNLEHEIVRVEEEIKIVERK